jgi:hypothetical protein
MNYRCVKANNSNDVIAIGRDENQANRDYNGVGTWCDFTFDVIPELSSEILSSLTFEELSSKYLLKVVDSTIVVKSLEEISNE